MHELSIAMSIIEMAEEEVERRGGAHVSAVHLKLGALSGVVEQALLSSFQMAAEDTSLQGARLLIESVPAAVFCTQCCSERQLASIQDFSCPVCGAPTPQVTCGRELEVTALEIVQ
jgi:hydrogenase nickel incorporation protein HypA/HybF